MDSELKAYVDERFGQLSEEIADLRSQLEQLRGTAPAQKKEPGVVADLEREAPPDLISMLRPTLRALQADWEQRPSKQLALLGVELVELCEEVRRSADLSHPFFDNLESRLQQVTSELGLEAIWPNPGEAYRAADHLILQTLRGGARDSVERCLKRGFRFQGQLLKKAEVSVFL